MPCAKATSARLPSAGRGRVDVFIRARDGGWEASHRIRLPKQAEFEDYAALAYRDRQLAVVSQASARLWVARIDEEARALVSGSEARYRFPSKSYGNIEGIAWLSRDTLVAVSDRKKSAAARTLRREGPVHSSVPDPGGLRPQVRAGGSFKRK